MTLEELTKGMNEDQLRRMLLELNNDWKDFEGYLISELGFQTYMDLANGHAKQKAATMMRELGCTDEDIDEFLNMKGEYSKEVEA